MRTVMDRTVVGADYVPSSKEDQERREHDQKEALMTMLTFIGFGMSLLSFLDSRKK